MFNKIGEISRESFVELSRNQKVNNEVLEIIGVQKIPRSIYTDIVTMNGDVKPMEVYQRKNDEELRYYVVAAYVASNMRERKFCYVLAFE